MQGIAGMTMAGSLRDRLKAWWHGYELDDEPVSAACREEPATDEESDSYGKPDGKGTWGEGRVLSAQRLFGAGYDAPEAFERTADLIKPLGLNPEMSVLEIGAGLGVGLRVVAGEVGAYIDGIEPNEVMVEEAQKFISMDGLQKRATPTTDDIFSNRIQRHRRDVIISRDAMHRMPERAEILAGIFKLLKPSGQFLMTDFMVNRQADTDQLIAWLELHEVTPNLWEMAEARNELKTMGLDVRVAKDESAPYCASVMEAIKKFAASLKRSPVDEDLREWVMWEVEYWARTVKAIESGALRHCRLHAFAPYEDPLQKNR